MKVSLNWIKEFTPVDLPVDKLVEKIGAQLGAVEGVEDLGKKYDGILVVKVVKCAKHPNADRLHACLIDDGGKNKQVKRNADGLIEVVCGAPNVKAGMLAAWIPPGATVPESIDKDPFVIEARQIRGQMSNGMLASAKELSLGDSHDGLLVLEQGKPGDAFAKSLWLDDHVIDIENKMFTHRPDCFGTLGVAREVAGINNQAFKSPDWYREDAELDNDGRKNVLKLSVKNDIPDLVPRFCAVAFKDVKVGPSPAWLQSFLARVGVRPVNNIVDVTNLVMLETGQPLHAYDYDKLKSGTLGVRMSKKGEELTVIGDKTLKLEHGAMVITDGQKPIGLGGVMGGAGTEVSPETRNVVLEAATFDMNATRRAAMAYGLFTDAATRFTKGQSPRQNAAAIGRAATLIKQVAGGRQASEVVDIKHVTGKPAALKVSTEFINQRLGLKLSASEVKELLENVEFKVNVSGNSLSITRPFWRTDVEIPEDIVEEVGRLYGYDKLPLELPPRDLMPAARNEMLDFKTYLRGILRAVGANEVLTYSFVHGSLLKAANQDPKEAFELRNALSPDLQYYRINLLPSLLEKVTPNKRDGFDNFALFEIGKSHIKGLLNKEGLPLEGESLAAVIVDDRPASAPYFTAWNMSDAIFSALGIHDRQYIRLDQFEMKRKTSWINAFEPTRSAVVWGGSKSLGVIGEPTETLRQALKLPPATSIFDLDINNLLEETRPLQYQPLNRFPEIEQDFCLRHPAKTMYDDLADFFVTNLEGLADKHGYLWRYEPIDIYQRPGNKTHKQTTWRIILSHPERTLTTQETNRLLDELTARAKTKLNAERI